MSFILFPERLKKPHSYIWELELWALLLLKFFFPEKVFKSLPLLCSAFSWQYVRTTHWDHLGNACVTSVGAAHGGSWFQLTPAAVNSTRSSVDECCIAHIPCGISVAVGWQDFLPAWKVRLEFYWVEEPVRDWGRCSKYCLYV